MSCEVRVWGGALGLREVGVASLACGLWRVVSGTSAAELGGGRECGSCYVEAECSDAGAVPQGCCLGTWGHRQAEASMLVFPGFERLRIRYDDCWLRSLARGLWREEALEAGLERGGWRGGRRGGRCKGRRARQLRRPRARREAGSARRVARGCEGARDWTLVAAG